MQNKASTQTVWLQLAAEAELGKNIIERNIWFSSGPKKTLDPNKILDIKNVGPKYFGSKNCRSTVLYFENKQVGLNILNYTIRVQKKAGSKKSFLPKRKKFCVQKCLLKKECESNGSVTIVTRTNNAWTLVPMTHVSNS